MESFQLAIHLVGDGLQPLVAGSFLHVLVVGEVLEPRVLGGSMPVLDLGRDSDDGAGSHLNGIFAPLLVPATASDANQHLHLLVMDVPVVTAAWFKGDIKHSVTHIGHVDGCR